MRMFKIFKIFNSSIPLFWKQMTWKIWHKYPNHYYVVNKRVLIWHLCRLIVWEGLYEKQANVAWRNIFIHCCVHLALSKQNATKHSIYIHNIKNGNNVRFENVNCTMSWISFTSSRPSLFGALGKLCLKYSIVLTSDSDYSEILHMLSMCPWNLYQVLHFCIAMS